MSLKNFDVLSQLGEGAFSSVYKVRRHEDNQIYALKKVKLLTLSEKEKENSLNEVRILASIKCPNIISYKESFLDKESSTLCLITEYANGGDLEKKIEDLKQKNQFAKQQQIWSVFIQIAKALKSLHSLNIAHRDLKSANVFLFKDGKVKIGDMNVSKVIKGSLCLTQTGTPYYASPQVWKDVPYNTKSDIWSLGCLIYQMAALRPPFTGENMEELYKKVLKGIYPKLSQQYSKSFRNLVRMMLQVDPKCRPDVIKLLEYAEDSYKKLFDLQVKIQIQDRSAESAKNIGQKSKTSLKVIQKNNEEQDGALLDTIKFPRKMAYLGSKLPKSNYEIPMRNTSNRKKISMKLLPSLDKTKNYIEQENYKEKIMKVKSQRLLPLPILNSRRLI